MLYVDLFESEAIAKFAYDPVARRLVVFFRAGAVYEYSTVPPEVFTAFRGAASKGQYFQAHVRARFKGRRLALQEVAALVARPLGGDAPPTVWVGVACNRGAAVSVFF